MFIKITRLLTHLLQSNTRFDRWETEALTLHGAALCGGLRSGMQACPTFSAPTHSQATVLPRTPASLILKENSNTSRNDSAKNPCAHFPETQSANTF